MNHMQALRIAEERSKKANEELAKIVKSNITRLERDLNNQTKNVLKGFRKNLGSTLQNAYRNQREALERKDLMIFILFLMSCLALGTNIAWSQNQQVKYQTTTYQGNTYEIVPQEKVLRTKNGQYMVRVE